VISHASATLHVLLPCQDFQVVLVKATAHSLPALPPIQHCNLKPNTPESYQTTMVFPFFALPRELRDQIYAYALSEDSSITVSRLRNSEANQMDESTLRFTPRLRPSLLLVANSQLHHETLPIYYALNTFTLPKDPISAAQWLDVLRCGDYLDRITSLEWPGHANRLWCLRKEKRNRPWIVTRGIRHYHLSAMRESPGASFSGLLRILDELSALHIESVDLEQQTASGENQMRRTRSSTVLGVEASLGGHIGRDWNIILRQAERSRVRRRLASTRCAWPITKGSVSAKISAYNAMGS
jgi:hypothetical protein